MQFMLYAKSPGDDVWAYVERFVNTGSFQRVSACTGVFDRARRVQATVESGASKRVSMGEGEVRWKKVERRLVTR